LITPLVVIYIVYHASLALYDFYKKSLIYGKANEWVVLMGNSGMKKAGVGICTFVGPYD
jgi:hypothetical protein